ncbi:MAG TPA: FHA domain-containing protein [Myxococcaceae bacterium]|nr:FHA domain-containing protein [Myxococcaceae bacterium]
MLSVKELRGLAGTLGSDLFVQQLGPFVLVQRPPPEEAERAGVNLSARMSTQMSDPEEISQGMVSLLFEFERLLVATLPPLQGVDALSVGRLPDNDLVLDDPSVSKRHAVIRWRADKHRCTVTDQDSTNGTFINGVGRVRRETTLRDGDIVSFGEVQFWYWETPTLWTKLSRVK